MNTLVSDMHTNPMPELRIRHVESLRPVMPEVFLSPSGDVSHTMRCRVKFMVL